MCKNGFKEKDMHQGRPPLGIADAELQNSLIPEKDCSTDYCRMKPHGLAAGNRRGSGNRRLRTLLFLCRFPERSGFRLL